MQQSASMHGHVAPASGVSSSISRGTLISSQANLMTSDCSELSLRQNLPADSRIDHASANDGKPLQPDVAQPDAWLSEAVPGATEQISEVWPLTPALTVLLLP